MRWGPHLSSRSASLKEYLTLAQALQRNGLAWLAAIELLERRSFSSEIPRDCFTNYGQLETRIFRREAPVWLLRLLRSSPRCPCRENRTFWLRPAGRCHPSLPPVTDAFATSLASFDAGGKARRLRRLRLPPHRAQRRQRRRWWRQRCFNRC